VSIDVIDVFAGPGGLNEGFSSITDPAGRPRFKTAASFEMDARACETLRLRATFRALRMEAGGTPRSYRDLLAGRMSLADFYARPDVEGHGKEAAEEVRHFELGERTRDESDAVIRERLKSGGGDDWVLIGGPPCQAYSLAGRSRRVGDPSFKDDHKHVLYREYLNIIAKFAPVVFVMENVKGMLSSQHEGGRIFERIKEDLESPRAGLRYEIRSLVVPVAAADLQPADFVIRAEEHGIPQRRHRVILMGVREDLADRQSAVLEKYATVSLKAAIGDLPAVRSRLSPLSADSVAAWQDARLVAAALAGAKSPDASSVPELGDPHWVGHRPRVEGPLGEWLVDPDLEGITLHEARRHMRGDLERYAYLAYMARRGKFPKVMDLPAHLMPNHRNAARPDAPFADRFRVQPWASPSTTVVSHIAKDGHYYIHPDPMQMRSLTVREAARLQTFPDNYLFVGNRTQQYHQVGNAVPPLLARQIGQVVSELLRS
jgi:DNA (cytosine-5)-methyltransferase 1